MFQNKYLKRNESVGLEMHQEIPTFPRVQITKNFHVQALKSPVASWNKIEILSSVRGVAQLFLGRYWIEMPILYALISICGFRANFP